MQRKSKTDSVRSPKYILDWVKKNWGMYFDPCPYVENWSSEKHTDGLKIEWGKVNYVNPPFSKSCSFLKKTYIEHTKGKIVVFLCKTSITGRKSFKGNCDIIFFRNAVCFPGYEGRPPPFVCCLLIFHPKSNNSFYIFEALVGNEFQVM
jgi:hypothetical protein